MCTHLKKERKRNKKEKESDGPCLHMLDLLSVFVIQLPFLHDRTKEPREPKDVAVLFWSCRGQEGVGATGRTVVSLGHTLHFFYLPS